MSDKCYFEMSETEANIENMMNVLEFANYQVATGNVFAIGDMASKEAVEKINDLTADISHQLCEAMDKLTEIKIILDDSTEELPEEIKTEQEKGHIFMHEVDCKDALYGLQGATVLSMEDIKFDGEDATDIIFKTKDGKNVELIYTMEALLCSEEYE